MLARSTVGMVARAPPSHFWRRSPATDSMFEPFYQTYAAGRTNTSPANLLVDFYHRFGRDSFGGDLDELFLRGPAAAVE